MPKKKETRNDVNLATEFYSNPDDDLVSFERNPPKFQLAPRKPERDVEGESVDLGWYGINSKWVRGPEEQPSYALKQGGKAVDPAMKNIEKAFLTSVTPKSIGAPSLIGGSAMTLNDFYNKSYSDRKEVLQNNPAINEAFAKGIFETKGYGLKRWSTRGKILKDPEYKALSKTDKGKFDKIKHIIKRYESSGGTKLMGVNPRRK
jgi:hypothetical protein